MDFKIKISLLLTIILFAQFQSNAQIGLKTKKSATKLFNTANEYVIGGITISGSEYLDEELLISISGLTIGDKIKLPNDATIAKAIQNLWKQNLFANIEINESKIVGEKIFLLNELIFIIFFLFIGIILVVAFLKIIHLKLNCYISYDLIRTFGHILFKRVLNQDFKIFESMNTKDVVTTILLRSQNVGEANFFMTTLFTSLTIVFFLLINIIYFAPLKIIIFFTFA
jgi:hypothetical protein